MLIVQNQKVCTLANCKLTDLPAAGFRTALKALLPEKIANPTLTRHLRNITSLQAQTLAIFEPAQFFYRALRSVAVATDTEVAIRADVIGQIKKTIAQIAFSTGADTGHCTTSSHTIQLGLS